MLFLSYLCFNIYLYSVYIHVCLSIVQVFQKLSSVGWLVHKYCLKQLRPDINGVNSKVGLFSQCNPTSLLVWLSSTKKTKAVDLENFIFHEKWFVLTLKQLDLVLKLSPTPKSKVFKDASMHIYVDF